ncbi:hypothetical protein AB0D08_19950 [Kitasatospora sp. NPDC048540]|uniref:hypothetical protein n=1 Tax=Kitasatospora sp. NPDC048540 TaxID=3155634 RepID=UPI0034035CD6
MLTFLNHPAGWQRVALVALALLPLLLVCLACAPALLVLPFRQDGTERADRLIRTLTGWLRAALSGSRG